MTLLQRLGALLRTPRGATVAMVLFVTVGVYDSVTGKTTVGVLIIVIAVVYWGWIVLFPSRSRRRF